MGGGNSTPKKEYDQAWRKPEWTEKNRDALVNELKNFHLNDPNLKPLRCLLCGPVGAGKSSFINSVNNVFQGRIAYTALADSTAAKSFTKTYKTHYIRNGPNRLHVAFNDVMGLEVEQGHGIHPDDIINALKGLIPEGYKFNPSAFTDKSMEQQSETNLQDRVHCLVYVIPGDKIYFLNDALLDKIKEIRGKASELGVPQVVVMTMPDKACEVVANDLTKIYTSIEIKQKMQTCSNLLGVPMDCILPVKNYNEKTEMNVDMDILILKAVAQIMNFANDYIWMQQNLQNNTCQQ